MLKYVSLLICLLVSPINDDIIEWRDSVKLDWDNFKGQPDESNDAVAITASGLTFGYSVHESNGRVSGFEASVKAHFYSDKSWYKRAKVNDTILMHERLHFDITEWHARLLRKQMASLQPSQNIASILEKLYRKSSQTLRKTQNTYDLETDHSRNMKQQFQWQEKVANELKKLEGFKE